MSNHDSAHGTWAAAGPDVAPVAAAVPMPWDSHRVQPTGHIDGGVAPNGHMGGGAAPAGHHEGN